MYKNIINKKILIVGGDSAIGKNFYKQYRNKYKFIDRTSRKKKVYFI